ncbi:unnamed protein product [Gordionus sp. m RMFG-2023]
MNHCRTVTPRTMQTYEATRTIQTTLTPYPLTTTNNDDNTTYYKAEKTRSTLTHSIIRTTQITKTPYPLTKFVDEDYTNYRSERNRYTPTHRTTRREIKFK